MSQPHFEAVPDPRLPQWELSVRSEWIDTNNHMNACYYLAIVKDAALSAHDSWGYGTDFRKATGQSNFVIESEVIYLRELLLGDIVVVTTRIVGLGDKRLRVLFEIFNKEKKYLAALVQYLIIHVRLGPPPKVTTIPSDLRATLEREFARHRMVPSPEGVEKLKGGNGLVA